MGFDDVLNLYLDKTKCTAKELAAASGISAFALSRYRSGKRIPDQQQTEKLICGLVQLARENTPELDEETIRNAFSPYTEKPKLDYQVIIKNLNAAIEALNISVSGLSRALSFDSSYLSRIWKCQRKPADLDKFILETQEWLDRQISRYQKRNFGLWAVVIKKTDEMIGQCGLTMQLWKEEEVLEIGYLFCRRYWHKGYAIEAAKACKKYAFEILKADEVCSIIRDTNVASQNVAIRNGMTMTDTWTKHYRGVEKSDCGSTW